MPVICPAILADTTEKYRAEMEKIAHFAHRIQIDLTDGEFTQSRTVRPEEAWWPAGVKADFHLMYKRPDKAIHTILKHQPHMIIVHAEADGSFEGFANQCHLKGVKVGVALLPRTQPTAIEGALGKIDHVLIFGGVLGEYGGQANLDLLRKVEHIKHAHPHIEVGWDGGINDQNISRLAFGGVDVFDVGGFIQSAADPQKAYETLDRIADETGTT
jgi:ribulose-phosphate 3-epimerase